MTWGSLGTRVLTHPQINIQKDTPNSGQLAGPNGPKKAAPFSLRRGQGRCEGEESCSEDHLCWPSGSVENKKCWPSITMVYDIYLYIYNYS